MPEGDTVFLAATRMHTALAGQRLVATDFRVPRYAMRTLLKGPGWRRVSARTSLGGNKLCRPSRSWPYRDGVKRDNFERLLADVRADHRAGRRNAIVTWQADRLLRTVEDASAIVAIAKRYETLVANVGGTIDLCTADGCKRFYEQAVAAQYGSELKSERLKLKHAELRRNGKWAGGRRPFGYKVVGTKLHSRKRADCTRSDNDGCPLVECELELEPTEADVIYNAVQRILRGGSITGLQREWVRRGIRRPNGGIFTGQHLHDLLVNPRLIGRRRGQDLDAESQWPAILTVAEHEHLVAKLGPGRNPVGQRTPPGPRVYELRGFLYCAVERDGQRCGNRLRGKPSDAKRRYVCDSRDGGCEGVKVVADAVQGHVRDAVIAAFDDSEMGPKIRQRLAAKLANPAREQELVAAREAAKDALARLGDDYADGLLTGVQVERATRRLQQRIDAAEEQLAGIRQSSGTMVDLPDSAEAMRLAWNGWDIEERFTADRVEFDWLV